MLQLKLFHLFILTALFWFSAQPVLADETNSCSWHWYGPVNLVDMPGKGDVQTQNDFIIGNTLNQGIIRNNQIYTSTVPITNDNPSWTQRSKWLGPYPTDYPGSGPIQSVSTFVINRSLWIGLWRGNQGWTQIIPIKDNNQPDFQCVTDKKCPWYGPLSLSDLPGKGDVQTSNNFIIGDNLYQGIIRNNQIYSRNVQIVNGIPDWSHASKWSGPFATAYPGSGPIRSVSTSVIGNNIWVGLWRGNQGWTQIIPIVDGNPRFDQSYGPFIKRCGSQLFQNGKPVRMSGTNSLFTIIDPCFGFHDNDDACRAAKLPNPDYTDHFRIDDLMDTAAEMGLTYIRIFAPSAGCPKCIEPELNQFNDDAFGNIDYHIKAAKDRNLRIILTLVNNWDDNIGEGWVGSKYAFLKWRGFTNDNNYDFFFNQTVISDYKNYISHVLNHVNPLTGIAYKDDPTIMAFETGNELLREVAQPPSIKAWTKTITDHIRSIAPNQLIIDGNDHSLNETPPDNVDILQKHYLATNEIQYAADKSKQYNRPFSLEEYGWNNVSNHLRPNGNLAEYLDLIDSSGTSMFSFWELYYHHEVNGWVTYEYEPSSEGGYALLYPSGKGTNDPLDTKARSQLIRNKSYQIRGLAVPPHKVPTAPLLHPIEKTQEGLKVNWRGVVAANTYEIQRSTGGDNWQTIKDNLNDGDSPWIDQSIQQGKTYSYRIRAINLNQIASPYSKIITSTTSTSGDLNKDGKVNIFDYNELVSKFGKSYTVTDYKNILENFGK